MTYIEVEGIPDGFQVRGDEGQLKSGDMADKGIIEYVDELNDVGIRTLVSCSGLRSDHCGVLQYAYLCVIIPNNLDDVGWTPDLEIFDLIESNKFKVKHDRAYARKCCKAGKRAGWKSKTTRLMYYIPCVDLNHGWTLYEDDDLHILWRRLVDNLIKELG